MLVAFTSEQTFLYHLYDALMDFINGAIAVDCGHTQRLAGGDLLVFVEDAAIERGVFLSQSGFRRSRLPLRHARCGGRARASERSKSGISSKVRSGWSPPHKAAWSSRTTWLPS